MEGIVEHRRDNTSGDASLPREQMTVYFRRYTIGKKVTCTACARGKSVSPGVLACLGSMMAAIKALDHANAHLLLLFPEEVRAANKQPWCTQTYECRRFCTGKHCAKRMSATIS